MATQAQTSHHLTAARQLLDDAMAGDSVDPQVKATAAAAHATLVLAEQVAAVRLVMAADAVATAEPAPHRGNEGAPAADARVEAPAPVAKLRRAREFYAGKLRMPTKS
jgi:hypothetical protein